MATTLLVVVGSGPGIGVHTGALFASKGFHSVALISRNPDRLQADKASVQNAGADAMVKTYPADVGNYVELRRVLQQVEKELGIPTVVLFNAARIAPTTIGETTTEEVLEDFKTMTLGLYETVSWAKPQLEACAKETDISPCFFLSGGGVGDVPLNSVFSLSMQKAAQQNLMRSLKQVLDPSGVHVAYVSIDGEVSDDDPQLNAKHIASLYWDLYQETRKHWRDVVAIGDLSKINPFAKRSS